MQWSDKDISRIEGKFDSFCKTVLRNFARDWYRAKRKHHATEVLFSELPNGQLFEPVHNDPICPLGQYLFDDLELPINITDDALAQALRHYQGYMLKLSQFELYDASGTVYSLFDKDLYQELQFKLVKAILDRFEL